MRTRALHTVLAAFAALVLAGSAGATPQAGAPSGPPSGPTLAVVRGERIEADAFRAYYVPALLRLGLPDGIGLRKRALSDLVGARLLVQEARARGLDRTEAFRAEEARLRRRLLLDLYTARRITGPVTVSEAETEEVFRRANTTVNARHLYARTLDGARALKARLDRGEAFEALAREVFADTVLANRGGRLPAFSFDEMDAAFETAAMTLPVGRVSDPVRTAYGYSLIEVLDRFTKPLATETEYAAKKPRFEAYVRRHKQDAAKAAFVDRREAETAVRFDAAGVAALYARVAGRAVTPDAELAGPANPVVLSYTFGGRSRTWTLDDVARRAALVPDRTKARVRSEDDLRAFLRGLVVQETIIEEAQAAGFDRDAEYQRAVVDELDGALVKARRAELAAVNVPEDSVRALYARHRADLLQPARAEVYEILVETRAEADRLKARLDAGAAFPALARQHSVREGADRVDGRLGLVTAADLGALGARVFAAPVGAVVGPVEVAGRYALLTTTRREDPRPMPYADARGPLAERLRTALATRAVDAHLAALRDAGGITVDLPALAALSLTADP